MFAVPWGRWWTYSILREEKQKEKTSRVECGGGGRGAREHCSFYCTLSKSLDDLSGKMIEIYHESPDYKVVIGWLLFLKGHSTSRVTAFLASEKGDFIFDMVAYC